MKSLRTKGLADLLGVTPNTVRSWVEQEKIAYHRTPNGHLFFTEDDIRPLLATTGNVPEDETWAYYLRSPSGRKSSLENQEKLLRDAFPEPTLIIKDSASGLNENRKGLKRLLELADTGKVTNIGITTPDRLSRFGVTYLEAYFRRCGVTVHYLSQGSDQSPEEELMGDFMALIASFSGRFYKMRGTENQKKLLARAQEELSS